MKPSVTAIAKVFELEILSNCLGAVSGLRNEFVWISRFTIFPGANSGPFVGIEGRRETGGQSFIVPVSTSEGKQILRV